jgi:hypothetical protein
MKFLFVTCLLLCAFPRTYAFQDSTIAHLDTLSQFDHKSVSAARPLPYYDIHLAMGTAIATRLGARVQFHPHYSVEVFFGQPPAWGFFGPVQHVRAGFGLNWHSMKWPNLVFSLLDVTDWIPGRADAVRPWNKPFQYNLVVLSAGYFSMQNPGVSAFIRAGFGYEFFRNNQSDLVHGFSSLVLDAGIGVTF